MRWLVGLLVASAGCGGPSPGAFMDAMLRLRPTVTVIQGTQGGFTVEPSLQRPTLSGGLDQRAGDCRTLIGATVDPGPYLAAGELTLDVDGNAFYGPNVTITPTTIWKGGETVRLQSTGGAGIGATTRRLRAPAFVTLTGTLPSQLDRTQGLTLTWTADTDPVIVGLHMTGDDPADHLVCAVPASAGRLVVTPAALQSWRSRYGSYTVEVGDVDDGGALVFRVAEANGASYYLPN